MAYLLMSAVFLLLIHTSVCEEDHIHTLFVTKSDSTDRCSTGPIGDLCQMLSRATKNLDNDTCTPLNLTKYVLKEIPRPGNEVIDGHTNLTLHCPMNESAIKYQWFTPCNDTNRCDNDKNQSVCTFQPKPSDDNENVSCVAVNRTGHALYAGYLELNLKYPPQQAPNIKTPQKVKAGSDIECTVSGGKPPVANVKLNCLEQQDLSQVGDTPPKNGVNSSRTVALKVALKVMNCQCSAYWEPNPEFYTKSTQKYVYVYVSAGKQPATRASGFVVAALIVVVLLCVM